MVAKALPAGMYNDGGGLYLQVAKGGTKSWIFRFMLAGRAREMGLGSVHDFSLREARERAREARQLTADEPYHPKCFTKFARGMVRQMGGATRRNHSLRGENLKGCEGLGHSRD
ncbi:Arm DNA-binding domain-containing protein [Brucella sp. 191011898]|uniref:Arm DNA-binding domain-containing protein n=2 Tax=Brucella TaxID=234 RepID=UPI0035301827